MARGAIDRRLVRRLVRDLKAASFAFYTSIDEGDLEMSSWKSIYRRDFKRWDATIAAAKQALERAGH